jgi:HTH-type transcriptional regulator / antitoxin HipB
LALGDQPGEVAPAGTVDAATFVPIVGQVDSRYAITKRARSNAVNAGALLRGRRCAHGLTQHGLAIRAGTRQATISRIENGHEIPTVQRLDQLLTALGERLELRAVPLDTERDAADLHADRAKSMTERLEDGFALASFASQLAGNARR